ncbi:uncharacterized protein LOC125941093 [Dermacentor silvarum]|uniref:uncharacterized protein LOC125941093 n=1 Tax=Dermacentor silvarum TaxID=543639 RepID=UPI002101B466|nr:uncharacterized protein LOC125941093 [Dermacentor silvarum]
METVSEVASTDVPSVVATQGLTCFSLGAAVLLARQQVRHNNYPSAPGGPRFIARCRADDFGVVLSGARLAEGHLRVGRQVVPRVHQHIDFAVGYFGLCHGGNIREYRIVSTFGHARYALYGLDKWGCCCLSPNSPGPMRACSLPLSLCLSPLYGSH